MAQSGRPATPGNGSSAAAAQPVVQVLNQYIKDLSFENPNIDKLIAGETDQPKLEIEVNVNAKRLQEGLFESAIEFHATAESKIGIVYELELVYAGLFRLENVPEQAIEQAVLIGCPSMLFPFVRRLVADISREGGFPPLLLDPIDFGALYVARQQQLAAGVGAGNQVS